MNNPLYSNPDLLAKAFPVELEEVRFFRHFLPKGARAALLDLGGGTGHLMAELSGSCEVCANLDLALALLGACPGGGVCGDLCRPPFLPRAFDLVLSRLFAVAYATAVVADIEPVAVGLGELLRPGGSLVLELPVAHRPRKVQGMGESYRGEVGYRFLYHDVLRETPFGAVLAATIEVEDHGRTHVLDAPLHVFSVDGAKQFFQLAGIGQPLFHAPYDRASATANPPSDCLRAVVAGRCQAMSDKSIRGC